MPDDAVTLTQEEKQALDEHKKQIRFAIRTIKDQIKELRTQQLEANKLITEPNGKHVVDIRDMIVSCSRQIEVYLNRLMTLQQMLNPKIKAEPSKPSKAKKQSFVPGTHLIPKPSVFTPPAQTSAS